MSFLNLDGGSGSAHIVERLVLERKRRTAKSVGFDAVDVDEAILQAAVLLFRDRQQQYHTPAHRQRNFSIDSGRKKKSPPPLLPKHSSSFPNSDSTSGVKLEKLCINNCPANPFLEYLIEAAMGMDLFREFELQGNMEEEEEQAAELEAAAIARRGQGLPDEDPEGGEGDETENVTSNIFALDALGFRMRFSRRLRKLELINLPITRDHAESLMYGIETNVTTGTGCRLDTLMMEGVRFVQDDDVGDEHEAIEDPDFDGDNYGEDAVGVPCIPNDGTIVVKEICEGFPNNSTLQTIEFLRCRLTDAQIALIFRSLAHHPTLANINLSENSCRKLGLEALDSILISPQWMPQSTETKKADGDSKHYCKIEFLDLSYQFTSEETYGTGEHIQLDILTRNCTTTKADIRIYPNLRKLVLQGNQIDDSDMEDLAFLIRHRFPRLEELDLRFNEITTEGLEAFVNHSDPNNDSYLASNNSNDKGSDGQDTTYTAKYKDHFPPPASRLRTIRLTNNPLVMTNQTLIVILKLLKIYPELQQIQSNLEWEDKSSVAQYIQHLLDINRAGRVLLLASSNGSINKNTKNGDETLRPPGSNASSFAINGTSHKEETLPSSKSPPLPPDEEQRRWQLMKQRRHPIPLAAWPLVLARLTRKTRYPHYIPKKNSLNGMYYLIRHGPIIMEQMVSRANNSKKKKHVVVMEPDRKRKRGDPALGGYATLADFLRCELGDEI